MHNNTWVGKRKSCLESNCTPHLHAFNQSYSSMQLLRYSVQNSNFFIRTNHYHCPIMWLKYPVWTFGSVGLCWLKSLKLYCILIHYVSDLIFTCHVDAEYRVPLLCHFEFNSIFLHGKLFMILLILLSWPLPLLIYVIRFLSCRFAHGEGTLLSLTLFQCMYCCA